MHNLGDFENIIFDLGGVIINLDYKRTQQAFEALGMQNVDEVYSQQQQQGLFDQFERGEIPASEFINELKGKCAPGTTDDQIRDAWNAILLDFPVDRLNFLGWLGDAHRLFLLSNTNEIHFKAFNELLFSTRGYHGLDPFFEEVYYSHLVHKRKPEKDIFELVLQENNLDVATTLFLDDSETNVIAAEELGISTIHILPGLEFTKLY